MPYAGGAVQEFADSVSGISRCGFLFGGLLFAVPMAVSVFGGVFPPSACGRAGNVGSVVFSKSARVGMDGAAFAGNLPGASAVGLWDTAGRVLAEAIKKTCNASLF